MMLKRSYSDLFKENRKRYLSLTLVTAFFFLIRLILFVIGVQNILQGKDSSLRYEKMLEEMKKLAGPDVATAIGILILSILSAACLFSFLHTRKKADFYEALPVKRETMFLLQLKTAFVLFLIPMFVCSVLECVIIGITGFFTGEVIFAVLKEMLSNLILFLSSWFTMALAMIMTGNSIVGLLGYGVFSFYFPVVLYGIFPCYADIFFTTWAGENFFTEKIFSFLSPVWPGLLALRKSGITFVKYMVILAVWIVLLFGICLALYKKRPSEAAGKAMAFPKANGCIRFLLVVPASLYTGYAFYSLALGSATFWVPAGILIGCLLFHGLIESIYAFDVHAFLYHKKQLGAALVIAFLTMGIFWGDLFGYDRYIPEASRISKMVIEPIGGYNSGFLEGKQNGIGKADRPLALSLVRQSVKEDKKDGADVYFNVSYTLKNGKKVKRSYGITSQKAKNLYNKLYATRDFKDDIYSLYTVNPDRITSLEWSNGIISEILNFTKEEKKEFLTIYLKELAGLSYYDAQKIIPIGSLAFSGENYEDPDLYYIYPSFTETISFLMNRKIPVKEGVKDLDIISLSVTNYEEETGENHTYTVEDKELIEAVKGKLILSDLCAAPDFSERNEEVSICVRYRTANGKDEVICQTDYDTAHKLE